MTFGRQSLGDIARQLAAYCQTNGWSGYDPYDALNSRFLDLLPLLDSRIPRLVLTQALKRSPVNIRRLMLIPKTQNAKAIALFLSGYAKLSSRQMPGHAQVVTELVERLIDMRSADQPYSCWGYSFPWQTRSTLIPRGAPNLVCTVFAANALLDAYERFGDARCFRMAISAAEFILTDLYWENARSAGFSYPTSSPQPAIHNANLLGAALLCRVHRISGEAKFVEPALRVARYSVSCQRRDGSWPYGEQSHQAWIDNFHTAYNLSALAAIDRHLSTAEFEPCIQRGLAFYLNHFFREDGAVNYFHNRTYPIDIHSVAVAIITLLDLKAFDDRCAPLAHRVLQWTMANMWNPKGYFYYRVLRYQAIRTSYMRWSQAWMFLALATAVAEEALMAAQAPRVAKFA